jgi:hypothetical protein
MFVNVPASGQQKKQKRKVHGSALTAKQKKEKQRNSLSLKAWEERGYQIPTQTENIIRPGTRVRPKTQKVNANESRPNEPKDTAQAQVDVATKEAEVNSITLEQKAADLTVDNWGLTYSEGEEETNVSETNK